MSLGAKKVAGVLALFMVVCACTSILSPFFLDAFNIENLLRRSALFGIISIGAAFVIMTGGIDLSIGSVIALVGCLVPWLLVEEGWSPWAVLPLGVAISLVIGLRDNTYVACGSGSDFAAGFLAGGSLRVRITALPPAEWLHTS